jgi:hypothetical protein
VFIDPPDDHSRLWAIDLALRSSGVSTVIADGSRLSMASSRRLQLAAASGGQGGALCLLARPPWEITELSAAATRWMIRRASSGEPRALEVTDQTTPDTGARCSGVHVPLTGERRASWTVELLRHKGMWSGLCASSGRGPPTAAWDQDVPRVASLEWDHETGACVVHAHVVRGPHQAPRTKEHRLRGARFAG